ncbi:hypothetical protein NDU88_008876 [Pleurodeles waltl]|uniref:Secreted protein n=1 Tax=Pleurodeles waltl TaxID=8319 RepID=A0AAV7PU83_PLEWA|nr:hypothetical protein NDU88_008876 [Pleurodeles waltl]
MSAMRPVGAVLMSSVRSGRSRAPVLFVALRLFTKDRGLSLFFSDLLLKKSRLLLLPSCLGSLKRLVPVRQCSSL